MPEDESIPHPIEEAYKYLLQCRIVDIVEPLAREKSTQNWLFRCAIRVACPNPANIPPSVTVRVVIPEMFPLSGVKCYVEDQELIGFAHQSPKGKLCLPDEEGAPLDKRRLVYAIRGTQAWITDAARNNLLQPGDSYELPAFSIGLSLPTHCYTLFEESAASLEVWQPHTGSFGTLECFMGRGIRAILASRFLSGGNNQIHATAFAPSIVDMEHLIQGYWILLPDICATRHQPPRTYGELEQLCQVVGLDLYDILFHAWRARHSAAFGLILVGFPIPKIVGDAAAEIHWQPLIFNNRRGEVESKRKPNRHKERRLKKGRKPKSDARASWRARLALPNHVFAQHKPLPWGESSNVAHARLYARGGLATPLQNTRVTIAGCGALGSTIAELLGRGGVQQLNLFDQDILMIGNMCRHTLDGTTLGRSKAEALADRLSATSPLSHIKGYAVTLPLGSDTPEAATQALNDAELLIDCTADAGARRWLSNVARCTGRRMVTAFFNFGASFLTLCISGQSTSCEEVYEAMTRAILAGLTPVNAEAYSYDPPIAEGVREGAGCWHPTFPASYSWIQLLGAATVELLDTHFASGTAQGLGVIIQRSAAPGLVERGGPLIEIVYREQYP